MSELITAWIFSSPRKFQGRRIFIRYWGCDLNIPQYVTIECIAKQWCICGIPIPRKVLKKCYWVDPIHFRSEWDRVGDYLAFEWVKEKLFRAAPQIVLPNE